MSMDAVDLCRLTMKFRQSCILGSSVGEPALADLSTLIGKAFLEQPHHDFTAQSQQLYMT